MTRLDERRERAIGERDLRGHAPMLAQAVRELLERAGSERHAIQRAWMAEVRAARDSQAAVPCKVICMRGVRPC